MDQMYVNTCAEYCVLKAVAEENDPYDDCCYVNGAAIDRNAEELLKTIHMERETGFSLSCAQHVEDTQLKQSVHPLLQKSDSPHVNPLLRL